MSIVPSLPGTLASAFVINSLTTASAAGAFPTAHARKTTIEQVHERMPRDVISFSVFNLAFIYFFLTDFRG
jgi:hypothetical protein